MVYSDVIENNLIQPAKRFYTMTDVHNVQVNSLFKNGETLTTGDAVFVIKCSAIYHGTDYSKPVRDWHRNMLKRMIG